MGSLKVTSLLQALQFSGLTAKEQELAAYCQEFTKRHKLDLLARQIDRTGVIPDELWKAFQQAGFFGFLTPPEFGGTGGTVTGLSILGKHIGGRCFAIANVIGAHVGLCSLPIIQFGTEDQKRRYLPRLASGEWIGSLAVTEPGSGANPEYTACTATPANDGYIIDGTKTYVSNGPIASLALTLARTDPSRLSRDALSLFLVDESRRGFGVGQVFEEKMGMQAAPVSELLYQKVEVSPQELLGGAEGKGWEQLVFTLEHVRLFLASLCLGVAHHALEVSLDHAQTRRIGTLGQGMLLHEFEGVQGQLVEMATTAAAMEAAVFETANGLNSATAYQTGSSMTKVFCSEHLGELLASARMLSGGASYMKGNTIERLSREQPISEIYEGPNMVLKLLIAGDTQRALSNDGEIRFVDDDQLGQFTEQIREMRTILATTYQTVRANKVRRHQTVNLGIGEAATLLYVAECMAKDASTAAHDDSGALRTKLCTRFCATAHRKLHSIKAGLVSFNLDASDEQEKLFDRLMRARGT